jgi:hypothetical protein
VAYVAGQRVKFVDALAKALGIAKPIKGLVLRARVGDIVRVEVESYLETDEDERVAGVIERFELNPEEKAEPEDGPPIIPLNLNQRVRFVIREGYRHVFEGHHDIDIMPCKNAYGQTVAEAKLHAMIRAAGWQWTGLHDAPIEPKIEVLPETWTH